MKTTLIPYGRAGWEHKMRLLEELVLSRPGPPFIYNDILMIVSSSRMKRSYGRLFLDTVERLHRVPSLVQPEIQTLHQFLHHLYSRLPGPKLIDENSRLVLLEGIVKQFLAGTAFSGRAEILAPSLSSAIASMIEQLSTGGVTADRLRTAVAQTDFSDKPQVVLLMNAYHAYEEKLSSLGLTDPAGMRSYLAGHFDTAWLAPYAMIIIDGMHDAGELEARVLTKIASHDHCVYLVDAPSQDMLKRAGDFHPLRIPRDLLSRLGVTPVEESASMDAGDRFLAETLFSDKPFEESAKTAAGLPSFSKTLNVLSAVNSREEVSLIAGEVKKSLRAGTAPDSVLVAFPSLDEYGPLVEEIFTDYGIPYNRALGRQMSSSAVAISVISLLRACREDFSGPSLLRIFSSPFLKFAETPRLALSLDRLMRDRRIMGGKHKLLSALKHRSTDEAAPDILAGPLNDLLSALEPFSSKDAAPLSLWMERLHTLVVWSGLAARVSTIMGPLSINLQAYRKLGETLASLARAGRQFAEYTYTFTEWFFLLRKTLMHARFQVPPEDEGGVQVLGLGESMGRRWSEVYLGGLTDGKFPQRLPQNIFLPEATLETLGVRTLEQARLNAASYFYRLLLSAPRVTLTWPENEGDRPMVPSPFLEELTPLRKAGLINRGVEKTSGIQFNLKIGDSGSIPELAKAVSLAGSVQGLEKVFSADIEGMAGIRSAIEYRPAEPAPAVVPQQKRVFRVTELDDYLNCPYDYYIRHVLDIEPLEEVTEDISPLDRGSKVHVILRNFYLSWNKPVAAGNRDEARTLLKKLADSAFDIEADTFRNRRDKELFLTTMAERFLDAEEEFWKQGMRPIYLEQKIEHYRLVLSSGEEVDVSARIDRIDVDEKGDFVIVDYKTGKYPQPRMNIEQDIFQLPVYAVMARQSLNIGARHALTLRNPIGLAYYDLKGKTGAGARDVVLYNKEVAKEQPASKPKASPKSAGEFEAILKQSMDKARKAVEGILAGDFTSTPQDENKCRYCPNEMMCGKGNEE